MQKYVNSINLSSFIDEIFLCTAPEYVSAFNGYEFDDIIPNAEMSLADEILPSLSIPETTQSNTPILTSQSTKLVSTSHHLHRSYSVPTLGGHSFQDLSQQTTIIPTFQPREVSSHHLHSSCSALDLMLSDHSPQKNELGLQINLIQPRKLVPSSHRLYHSYSDPIVRIKRTVVCTTEKNWEWHPRLRRTSSMVYVDKGKLIETINLKGWETRWSE